MADGGWGEFEAVGRSGDTSYSEQLVEYDEQVEETVATILIVLPALLYAAGCLLNTEVMVAMLPERIPAIRVLVRALGVAFLVSAILLNFERFAPAAGWTMAGLLLVTAFGIHLPDVIKEYPEELGEEMIDLEQRAAIAGVVKDLALAGAAMFVAITAA